MNAEGLPKIIGKNFSRYSNAAFEISANEIYNLNAALTAAYFTTVFDK